MKNSLYMTSALVAAGVLAFGATDVYAAEKAKKMSLGISGFFISKVGYAKQASSFESNGSATTQTGYGEFDAKNDSEIHFKGTTKLDNGIAVSVQVEIETDQSKNGTQIDGSFLKLTGGFGDVRIGSTSYVSATLSHKAPSAGALNYFGPDSSEWIQKPTAVGVSAVAGGDIGGDDSMKISYFSPRFSGFGVGVSWQPSNANNNNMPAVGGTAGTDTSTINGAVVYENKVGSADIKADVGYWATDAGTASLSAYQLGASVGFGAFSVGGQYMSVDAEGKTAAGLPMSGQATSVDEEAFAIGVGYKTGPLSLAANYYTSERPFASATAGDDTVTKITLGATYTMGPGVDLLGSIQHVDWEDETTTDANNNKGFAVVGGVKVSF